MMVVGGILAHITTLKKHSIKTLVPHGIHNFLLCVCENELVVWNIWDEGFMTTLLRVDVMEGLIDACFIHNKTYLIALLKTNHVVIWNMENKVRVSDTIISGEHTTASWMGMTLSSDNRYLVIYGHP
jgi:hypothetical protein